jgi:trigger factor
MTKVSMETVDAVRRRLAVEVPAGEVAARIERAYDELRRTASVRGFRPGRAPRSVLEQLFGERVRVEVFSKLVQDSYLEALREQSIEPVGQPEIVTERAEPGEALRYSAVVEVKPAIVVSGYKGLAAERREREITETDVDAFLEDLRQSNAHLHPIDDRSDARRGDVATIDYVARIESRIVGRGDGRRVPVGSGSATDVGERLVGARIGEPAEFTIDYPAEYGDADVAGRQVSFRVEVKALASKHVPELDDEFAKDHGDAETLAELRHKVGEHLSATARREADSALRDSLLDHLVRGHEIEVPQAMVAHRTEAMVDEFLDSLGSRRPPASREAEVRSRLGSEMRPRATEQVKASLILEAIAAQERLDVADDEVEERIERLAERGGANLRPRIRAVYQEPAARESLRERLLQEKALDLVLQHAEVRTVDANSGVADASGNG